MQVAVRCARPYPWGAPAGVAAALEFEKHLRQEKQVPRSAPLDSARGKRDDRTGADEHASYLLLEKKALFTTLRNFAKCKPLFYASTGEREVKGELWWGEGEPGGAGGSGGLVAGG